MKSLIGWKEFGDPNAPSIFSVFSPYQREHEDAIANYLDNGKVFLVSAGISTDVFTGEMISGKHELMTDGEYFWNTDIPYYVRKYHMKLPHEFEQKVLDIANM